MSQFFFNNRNRRPIPRHATFRITQEGKERVQEFTGDPLTRILAALESRNGSCDMDELAQETQLSRGQIERTLPKLLGNNYVTMNNPSAMMDAEL